MTMQETAKKVMAAMSAKGLTRTSVENVEDVLEALAKIREGGELPARDPSRPAEAQGLFQKFIVQRVDGSDLLGGKHYGCLNFVLDLTHDPHAIPAIQAYAAACASTHPQLAADLFFRFGAPPERRRELQTAPLPRDAEYALEHAAIALDKVGDTEAHTHVTDVLRDHLPPEQQAATWLQPAEAPRAEGYVDQDAPQTALEGWQGAIAALSSDPVCEHCGGTQVFNGGPCGACASEKGGA